MVTSTKISYLGSFCSSYAIDMSVILQVTWCLYRLYFYLKIMSVIFYVVSCDMLLCLTHIYWTNECWIFESILYVYVAWKHSYISMYMCICTWLWYFILSLVIISVWYFIHPLCAIMWNTYITHDIYHFKS